jgi:hypothetical protein
MTVRKLSKIVDAVEKNMHLKSLFLTGNEATLLETREIMARVSPFLLRNQGKTVAPLLKVLVAEKETKYPHQNIPN